MVQSFMKSHIIESENMWFWCKGPMVQPFMKSHLIESDNFWFWSQGPMVQTFMKSHMIESENVWFWSKGPMVQAFMKSQLIESDNFWFWSKGPKIHPFLKCHLTESVDFFIWLSRFPSYGYVKQVLRNQSWLLLLPDPTSIPNLEFDLQIRCMIRVAVIGKTRKTAVLLKFYKQNSVHGSSGEVEVLPV